METAKLTGALLDYWVAKAQGKNAVINNVQKRCALWDGSGMAISDNFLGWFSPSTDWAQGGPIIEREKIATRYSSASNGLSEHW